SDFVNGIDMSRAEKSRLMGEKCERKWSIPFSQKTRISRETINHWIRIYNDGGVKELRPKNRSDQGRSRAMDDDTCEALICLRKEMPVATVPHLLEQMNQRKLVTPGTVLNTTTAYRFLHHQDLMRLTRSNPVDRRKFEAELPNDMWQSDVMHGPKIDVDGRQKKTYLIAILDDHSRLIVYARFYLSERLASYLDAFENALARRGLPRKLYVDNGPAFRSKHLEYISASLSITLIHARPYLPQGKGKIERWFKTVRSRFLPHVTATTLPELNGALDRYLTDDYHQRKHSATGQTPLDRFTSHMHCLRSAPENLKDNFRKVALRKVAKDRTITLDGRIYEAPVALIGKRVELLYHLTDPESIEVRYKNKSFGMLRPVDLAVNYRVKRDKNNNPQLHDTNHTTSYQGGKLWSFKRRDQDEE
ncbi:MAG: DDE-type integrase/transposase/recombinase, partial [Desulfobacterales bacterium]